MKVTAIFAAAVLAAYQAQALPIPSSDLNLVAARSGAELDSHTLLPAAKIYADTALVVREFKNEAVDQHDVLNKRAPVGVIEGANAAQDLLHDAPLVTFPHDLPVPDEALKLEPLSTITGSSKPASDQLLTIPRTSLAEQTTATAKMDQELQQLNAQRWIDHSTFQALKEAQHKSVVDDGHIAAALKNREAHYHVTHDDWLHAQGLEPSARQHERAQSARAFLNELKSKSELTYDELVQQKQQEQSTVKALESFLISRKRNSSIHANIRAATKQASDRETEI